MTKLEDVVLAEWRKKYPDMEIVRRLQSGKEADLWLVRLSDELFALKVYASANLSTRGQYTQGQWISEPSLRKAVKQGTKVGRELQQKLWTKREYYLLQKLHAEGAIVPQVFAYADNAILMQYLGDEQASAPRLIDVQFDTLTKKELVLAKIEASMKLLLDSGIVHADLSAYNILWWDDQPWIIDFPQAADVRRNPNWHELYERDLRNVRSYFDQ